MNKFNLGILLILSIITASLLTVLPNRICFEGADEYTFYLGKSSSSLQEIKTDSPALTRLTLGIVYGESGEYSSLDVESFLKSVGGEIVFCEILSDSTNYYCKANLPYSTELYGEIINLHICVRTDSVKVASPIIFGGY